MENANDDFGVKDVTVTLVSSCKQCLYKFQVSRVELPFSFLSLSVQENKKKN